MKFFPILFVVGALSLAGCNETKPTPASGTNAATEADAKIKATLDKLPADDRALADAQKLCPVSNELLGSMGVPIKVMLNDQPVFLCCKSCVKQAEDDPAKTLQKAAEVKAKNAKKDQ